MNEELYADEMWLIFKKKRWIKMILRDFFWILIVFGNHYFYSDITIKLFKQKNLELFEQFFIDKFFNLLKYIIEFINELNLDIF